MDGERTVYLLQHVHEQSGGEQEVKMIGIYSSRESAENAVRRLKEKPGFATSAEGFTVEAYTLDEDNWAEGFVTILHTGTTRT